MPSYYPAGPEDYNIEFEIDTTDNTITITGFSVILTIPSHLVIPNTIEYLGGEFPVVAIADGAFETEPGIESVTINSNLQSIGARAFKWTYSLHTIVFPSPSSLTSIGDEAFRNTGISSITFPASIETIGAYAFSQGQGGYELHGTVTFEGSSESNGGNLKSIGAHAFDPISSNNEYDNSAWTSSDPIIPDWLVSMGVQQNESSASGDPYVSPFF